jgi:hypothetical protein
MKPESETEKIYRVLPGAMNIKVRVYSSPQELYDEVRQALQNSQDVCCEAYDSVLWPQVEELNDWHNKLRLEPDYDKKIAPHKEKLDALKRSWSWLEQVQEELKALLELAWSVERAALMATKTGNSKVSTTSASDSAIEIESGVTKMQSLASAKQWLEEHYGELTVGDWAAIGKDGLLTHSSNLEALHQKLTELGADLSQVVILFVEEPGPALTQE